MPHDPEQIFRFFNEVMILSHLTGTAFETVMPPGMTLSRFGVLSHLCRVGDGHTQVRIANAMQVRKSTMTSTLAAMQAAGWVTISPDPDDGRSKRVHVTEAGRSARDAAIAALGPEIEALSGLFQPGDIAAGLPVLERVRRVMDARRD